MLNKVLITGANGFVGSKILEVLSCEPYEVCAAVRNKVTLNHLKGVDVVEVGDIDESTDWGACLDNIDVVVHVAARAHVMGERGMDGIDAYRKINLHGTLALAREASRRGVKRFIYISSIKALSEHSVLGQPLTPNTRCVPEDAYGISKLEAEIALKEFASDSAMELTIIRPPLVYGAGVKGNFASLAKLVSLGLPLPLGCVKNKRSLVAIDNLVDLIKLCISHPRAGNNTFLVSDDDDVSTTRLLRELASAQNVNSRLFCLPVWLMKAVAFLLNKKPMVDRLYGSLQVDITDTKRTLGWRPVISFKEGVEKMFKESLR